MELLRTTTERETIVENGETKTRTKIVTDPIN